MLALASKSMNNATSATTKRSLYDKIFNPSTLTNKILGITLKVLAILLLTCYCGQLYVKDGIDYAQVLPDGQQIFMLFLRWFTIAAVGIGSLLPFFKSNSLKVMFPFFAITCGILNFVFFDQNMIAWAGRDLQQFTTVGGFAYLPIRVAFFIIEQILFLIMGVAYIYIDIKDKEFKKIKPLWLIGAFLGVMICFMYPVFPEDLNVMLSFTTSTQHATDFSISHIIYLLLPFVIIIGLYVLLHKKDQQLIKEVLLVISLGSIFSFFYYPCYDAGGLYYSALPFHLCNTAVLLCFFAIAFHLEGLFFFTFFVNVLGCIFAMLMPNTLETDYWYTYNTIRFWYNHIVVFVLPILGVALHLFKRPTIKPMLKAIGVFTIYFLTVAFFNAWFTNYDPSVNYFFINDHYFFDKLSKLRIPTDLMDNYVWSFTIGDLTFTFYPVYHLIVYGVFVLFMFAIWYVYDFFFKVADAHGAIHVKKKMQRELNINFKKELNGRSLKEPLYEEAKDMIEIKHFTKVYSGSNKPSVDDLNLTIHDGEVYGFLGHNGAGKSTTIKSLVGIQTITSGQMIINGYDVAKQPVETKLRVGYVSDNHAVYENLTGREYINYIADLYMVNKADRDERISKYTKMFKLEDAIDNEIKSYSHGMKQKIVVIASLIHDPKVWILDEPLTGLDPTSAYQIKECMREHASRGNIVFFSSHVIEVVEKICTRICIISHGKLQCEYSLKELKEKGISLEELYLKYVSSEERIV